MLPDTIKIERAITDAEEILELEMSLCLKRIEETQKKIESNNYTLSGGIFWDLFLDDQRTKAREDNKYLEVEIDKLHKIKTFLEQPIQTEINRLSIFAVHEAVKTLLKKFFTQYKDSLWETKYETNKFDEELAIKCKYFCEIKELQKDRRKLLLNTVNDQNDIGGFQRIILDYQRDLAAIPILRLGDDSRKEAAKHSGNLWFLGLYQEERYFLTDIIQELNLKLQYLAQLNQPEENWIEDEIKQIVKSVKVEVEAWSACEQLIEQYPQHKRFIEIKFKEKIDSNRER